MILNEVLTRQNFITKIPFKNGDVVLSKDLKIKIMSMRIEYNKLRNNLETDIKEFVTGITPERYNELVQKRERSKDEEKEIKELVDKINSETNEYASKRGIEQVDVKDYSLSDDDFNEIVSIMSDDDIEINNNHIPIPDFLEIFYTLFVK